MIKVLIIDELLKEEVSKAHEYLKGNSKKAPIDGLYWLELPAEILDEKQKSFTQNHEPLKIAIEIGKTWVRVELLIRSESLINVGGGEINQKQLNFIYNYILKMVEYVKIRN